MAVIELASGSGYSSLQQAAQSIVAQMGNDAPGTKYEMVATINAPRWVINANIGITNQYLSNRGIQPWPGQKVIVYLDNQTTNQVWFQWIG